MVTFTARIDEDLAEMIDAVAKEEAISRSAVVRRFLTIAAKEWLVDKSLKDYEQGKLTLAQVAGKCGVSVWEIIIEAGKREIHVPYTLNDFKEDLKGLQKAT